VAWAADVGGVQPVIRASPQRSLIDRNGADFVRADALTWGRRPIGNSQQVCERSADGRVRHGTQQADVSATPVGCESGSNKA